MMARLGRRYETTFRSAGNGRIRLQQKQYGAKPWDTLVRRSHEDFVDDR